MTNTKGPTGRHTKSAKRGEVARLAFGGVDGVRGGWKLADQPIAGFLRDLALVVLYAFDRIGAHDSSRFDEADEAADRLRKEVTR